MPKKNVTIEDIARAANISKTTVSRFLNGKFEYMSLETKERIEEIIRTANFRPNKLASSLKSNRSHQIGVLIADICNPISSILVRGISDICAENGYSIIIYCTDSDLKREQEDIENLIDQRVDGILVNPADYDHSYDALADKNVPVVMVDRSVSTPVDTVMTDNHEITRETVAHLYEQGFRNLILFTEEPAGISTRHERIEAFSSFYRAHFTDNVADAICVIDPQKPEQVEESIRALFNKRERGIPAIFTVNGVCLLSVLTAIKHLGLRIPEDIAVCGYDDWSWAELVTPGITAIAQPSYQVGAESARLLLSKIADGEDSVFPEPVRHVLHAKLHIRGSTRFVSADA
ncbi:MAG: LacI family DNA-binding transcriptional regulator [Ethanoligenens sp.]